MDGEYIKYLSTICDIDELIKLKKYHSDCWWESLDPGTYHGFSYNRFHGCMYLIVRDRIELLNKLNNFYKNKGRLFNGRR